MGELAGNTNDFGVRRHVAALRLRDMSRSSKARTCLRTPKYAVIGLPVTCSKSPSDSWRDIER